MCSKPGFSLFLVNIEKTDIGDVEECHGRWGNDHSSHYHISSRHDTAEREVLYKSHGSGRLLTQSTIMVFWPSWYRPAF